MKDDIDLYWQIDTEILKQVDFMGRRRNFLNHLKRVKHYHKFGVERVCECGQSEREYHATLSDETLVCPNNNPLNRLYA